MLPLFEMMTKAQNGQAVEELARQFELSRKQAEDALAALMPAFSTGLKRTTSDPMGMAGFMQTLASAQHARYFEDMRKAFTPPGMEEGKSLLDYLFGSPEVARAVAEQVAQTTGIAQETLRRMLPPVAATLMGGLQKQASGDMPGANAQTQLARMMQLMTRQQAEWAEELGLKEKQPQPGDAGNPFMKAWEQMFAAGTAAQAQFNPMQAMAADNPFGKAFRDMLEGGFGQVQQPGATPPDEELHPEPKAHKQGEEPGKEAAAHYDIFGEMFEAGRKTQAEYVRAMEQIFDQYTKGTKTGS